VAKTVDDTPDPGQAPAVVLVSPAEQLAGVPDPAVEDLDRLRLADEGARRLVPRHAATV
jgi:hypothetical protein